MRKELDKLHQSLALAIRNGKRRMFKRNREGANLDQSAEILLCELTIQFRRILANYPTFERTRISLDAIEREVIQNARLRERASA